MQVDWFTVAAQIANFLILVWLLRRFLFGPILKAVGDRESTIKAQIQDAQQQDAKAKEELAALQGQRAELERTRASLLQKAQADAEADRTELIRAAREEAETTRK